MNSAQSPSRLFCLDVAAAFHLEFHRQIGGEHVYRCPCHDDQHPSLMINPQKNVWMCGPCHAQGGAWQFVAFLAGIDPADHSRMLDVMSRQGLRTVRHDAHFPTTADSEHQASRPGTGQILAAYAYCDENGQLLYEKLRYPPRNGHKDFRQRRPDGNGGWTWTLAQVRHVLYRLPELQRAVDVFYVEGEKDVDNLFRLGLTATTSGSVNDWRMEFVDLFRAHQHVVIIPDNDDPGRTHAEQVAAALSGHVTSVKILTLPGLPESGDVSDWLEGRPIDGAAEELAHLAEGLPEWSRNPPQVWAIPAPPFLATIDTPPRYLAEQLVPERSLILTHGEPRTLKSWATLHMCIALSTGRPLFTMERFGVREPVPALYCSQEDAAPLVRLRAKAILRALDVDVYPELLAFAVFQGIDLDQQEWQERLLRDTLKYGFRFIALDPIRRFGSNIDKGPAEVAGTTRYLRRLCLETGATIQINHHDVKPPANVKDQRRRSHKASGGDWFASADCPISLERIGDNSTLVIPEDYKLGKAPDSFQLHLETDHDYQPSIAKLIGVTVSADEATALALQEQVLAYLVKNGPVSTSRIREAIRTRREDVVRVLDHLMEDGKVDSVLGPRKAKLWFVR